jgi:hypothetical protein
MKGKLLKTIVPTQKASGKNQRYYPKGLEFKITARGFHGEPFDIPNDSDVIGRPLTGWIYDNLITNTLAELEPDKDFILI